MFMHHNLGPTLIARTMVLPDEAIQSFCPRKQQIYACEATAVPEAVCDCPDVLRGRDVTWYLDIEAACASFVCGASGSEGVSEIVAIALLTFMNTT